MSSSSSGFAAGFIAFFAGLSFVIKQPIRNAAWIIAIGVSAITATLWGSLFSALGWLESRKKLETDGLIGVGEVLVPKLGRQQYKDGVWTGLWRAHAASIAFLLVHVPILAFAFAPAIVAAQVLGPLDHPNAGITELAIGKGIPMLVALGCGVVVWAEAIVAYRLLAIAGPSYSIGLISKAVGAAWRATLADLPRLLGLAAALVLSSVVVGGILYGCFRAVVSFGTPTNVTFVIMSVLLLAIAVFFVPAALRAPVVWAEEVTAPSIAGGPHFSFSAWLYEWLALVFGWFARKGIVAVGIGICLGVGALTAVIALATGRVFSSWVGLGWFAVTAAVLVALRYKGAK